MKNLALFASAASLAMAGCMQLTPHLDAHFGETVNLAVAGQTLHPDAAAANADKTAAGMDGRAARSTLDGYQKSFRTPAPTYNIFSIGGSGGVGQ